MRQHLLGLAVLLAALTVFASAARAATTPALSLDQSAGTHAGATLNLGLDLKFADTGTDSPRNLVLNLPPGLLANASVDGGACLRAQNLSGSTCQVGTGSVTATPDPIPGVLNLPVSVSIPVGFYLVPPPSAGDLAGLAVKGLGEQIGATGDIRLRPSGDPNGVGLTLSLVLPDHLPITLPLLGTINVAQISLTEIKSTFDGLRYPASCPAPAARLSAVVDSYSDPTLHTVTAPLTVTGCSSLAFSPVFDVDAARDSTDRQVTLTTALTETADESPARSLSLRFPTATLVPNLGSIQALCVDLASGTCTPVGSVTATSPLYPAALHGKAYLTGSASGLALTLVFPAPFPLTLNGAVDLVKNSATFIGLPDIPLTNLQVTLAGGSEGLFLSTCQVPTGTATAAMTDQNGDKTVDAPATFTVSGCPGDAGASNASSPAGVTAGTTNLSSGRFSGLGTRRPSLSFRLRVARHAPELRRLTIALPPGLRFVSGRRRPLTGVTLDGAKVRRVWLSHGKLVILLRKPAPSLSVKVGSGLLAARPGLSASKQRTLWLTVIAQNTRSRLTTLHVEVHAG